MTVALPSTTANAMAKGGSSYVMTPNGFVDKHQYTEIHASIEKMMVSVDAIIAIKLNVQDNICVLGNYFSDLKTCVVIKLTLLKMYYNAFFPVKFCTGNGDCDGESKCNAYGVCKETKQLG